MSYDDDMPPVLSRAELFDGLLEVARQIAVEKFVRSRLSDVYILPGPMPQDEQRRVELNKRIDDSINQQLTIAGVRYRVPPYRMRDPYKRHRRV